MRLWKLDMWELIFSDVYRWEGNKRITSLFKCFLKYKGFRFAIFLRFASSTANVPVINIISKLLYALAKIIYTTDINFRCSMGPGFRIHHVFCTTWGPGVKIGANFTALHNVTIAGVNDKYPQIGDNVYIGTGSCILGDVKIGNNVTVGAHTLVNKDVPDNAVVVGSPFRIISYKGSSNMIKNPLPL